MIKFDRLLFLLFFLITGTLAAQYKISADPVQFPQDVNTMLLATKQTSAANFAGTFVSNWSSGFSDDEKKKIIQTTQEILKLKKIKAYPHYTEFFGMLNAAKAKGIPSADFDTLLYMSQKACEKYELKQIQTMFFTLRQFLEKSALHISSYNSLYVSGGSFRFGYVPHRDDLPFVEAPVEEVKIENQEEVQYDEWGNPIENQSNNWEEPQEEAKKEDVKEVLQLTYEAPAQPTVEGPVIIFTNSDFTFSTSSDSTTLRGTSGSVMLMNNVYVGKGGKFYWTTVGLSESDVHAELTDYNFPINSPKFVAEAATLYYPAKSDAPILGKFEHDVRPYKRVQDAQFPRFISWDNTVKMKGLGNNIEYEGGLTLSGTKISSGSILGNPATIRINKNGRTAIKLISSRFDLGDSIILSPFSRLHIYLDDKDSIYHPGVAVKYKDNSSHLQITKTGSFKKAPLIDTYHKIEITADGLNWDLNTDSIDISIFAAKNDVPALFESQHFFTAGKYSSMAGLNKFHPLQVAIGYCEKMKVNEFYADDLAKAYKLDVGSVRKGMMELLKGGYIDYDARSGLVKMRPKGTHTVLARRGKVDYDNITFISIAPEGPNATLNLKSGDLTVRGVDKIYISDSLNVFFSPDKRTVKITKNRDFFFDGKISTKNYQFVGSKFHFIYDSFLVHLPEIDQIRLAVDEEKKLKTRDTVKTTRILSNELRFSSGTLYINQPNNKSSKKNLPAYPIFDAKTGATVFFNKKNIAEGAYDTTMKFKIPPFKVDSLSSNDSRTIGFDGEFESGGIFPAFKERLIPLGDNSLGFDHQVPADGYQLYKGHGKYYNKLYMDSKGLHGDGEIHFLNTTLLSQEFMFYHDSVKTKGTIATTKPGTNPLLDPSVTFPDVEVTDYRMKWIPSIDSMYISNNSKPFILYKNTASLQGTTTITNKGMFGMGVLFTRGSESESKEFHFEETRFSGRHAEFIVKSDNPDKPALSCDQVKLDFDLTKNIATFSPEVAGYASTAFPYAQYKTSLDKGVWDLDKKTIHMTMPEGGDINKSYFYSTRKDQDSLVFNATDATYSIDKLNLKIQGIPYINVNDAKVYPDSNKVIVQENAVIRTLEKAKIVMDTVKEYHHLYDGKIDILGRFKFSGVATYQYVNLGSDTLSFQFTDFKYEQGARKKDGAYTVAKGEIKEEDSLFIGPKVLYKGKITMFSYSELLVFDGYVKLDLKGALSYSQWLKYDNDGTNKEVVIQLDNKTTEAGVPLTTGFYFDKKKNQLYTTFISRKANTEDDAVFPVTGVFQFDAQNNKFKVATPERLKGTVTQGNYFSYDDSTSVVIGEGQYRFTQISEAQDKNFKIKSAGSSYADLNANAYSFSTISLFYPNISSTILTAIGKDIANLPKMYDSTMAAYDSADYMYKRRMDEEFEVRLAQMFGDDMIKTYDDKKSSGSFKYSGLNSDFAKGMGFRQADFKWSPEYKAYYSSGDLHMTNILKNEIDRRMKGYIEIRKTPKGDIINIYLEPLPNFWYYFSYEDNRMSCITSNDALNGVISKKNKGEMPDRTKFFFVPADIMEKQKFVTGFRERYLNAPVVEQMNKEEVNDSLPKDVNEQVIDTVQKVNQPHIKQDDSQNQNKEEGQSQDENKNPQDYDLKNYNYEMDGDYNKYKISEEEKKKQEEERKAKEQNPDEMRRRQEEQQRLRDMLK